MSLSRGRLKKADKLVEEFASSISTDVRLYKYDIMGSIAHTKMLGRCKIISSTSAKKIIKSLIEIEKEIEIGKFKFRLEDEDIHLNIERRLIEKIGDVGKKIHTSRSRNDQIALDIRMFLRDEIKNICLSIKQVQISIVKIAEKNIDIIMPGYTHLQHAQPILFAHYLMSHFFAFDRDIERFEEVYDRVNIMPLGSCALSGSSFNIDRNYVASLLNFPKISENSIDAVSDRDFVIEFLSAASILMMHFSRLSEELILFSSQEFSFIELDDTFCTSSSIMPQKKNPDIAELVRGTTGLIYGNLISMLTIMKSLPLSYNRDMQLDKENLFNTIDKLKIILPLYAKMIETMEVKKENIKEQLKKGFLTATDIADYLTLKGVPFRTSYKITSEIVRYCINANKTFENLTLEEFKKFSTKFQKDILEVIKFINSVQSKQSFGGTAPSQVKLSITKVKKRLGLL